MSVRTSVYDGAIGEHVSAALRGDLDGNALQLAIGELLAVPRDFVQLDYDIERGAIELTIRVPR